MGTKVFRATSLTRLNPRSFKRLHWGTSDRVQYRSEWSAAVDSETVPRKIPRNITSARAPDPRTCRRERAAELIGIAVWRSPSIDRRGGPFQSAHTFKLPTAAPAPYQFQIYILPGYRVHCRRRDTQTNKAHNHSPPRK